MKRLLVAILLALAPLPGLTSAALAQGEGPAAADSESGAPAADEGASSPAPAPAASEPPAAGKVTAAPGLPPPPKASLRPKVTSSFWTYSEDKVNAIKIAFAILVIGLLVWGILLDEKGRGKLYRKQRRAALAFFGIVAVAGWFNFGKFHAGTFVHVWEHYHYYVGAKYMPELHYARLYECSAIAESEIRGAEKVAKRKMRDIADTNLIGSTADILAHPERCKEHFTEARWKEFKGDVAFFIRRMGDGQWERSQKDHGYNGTPWWSIGGTTFANLVGPASNESMHTLALIDPLLIIAMFGCMWWAFGLEAFVVAAVFFSVNYPSRYWWNGGAYLRYDYLAASLIGVCLLKKGKSGWGGALLAYGAASRIFPVMFVVGPVLQAGWKLWKDRKLPVEHRKILIGGVLATAFLVPASLLVAESGTSIYSDFAHNTLKHAETPLTNHMGLRTLLSWRPSDNARHLKDAKLDDPFKVWKEQRLENYANLKVLFVLLNLGFLWAIWRASRDEPAWVAAALSGVVLIASATELTCYYYGFLMGAAFLVEKRREFGLWLILLGISTHAMARLKIWDDEKYVWMSLSALVYGASILYLLIRPEAKAAEVAPGSAQEPALTPAVADAGAAAAAAGGKRKRRR